MILLAACAAAVFLPINVLASDTEIDIGGRVSPQVAVATYPDHSLFSDVFGSSSIYSAIDARVIFGLKHKKFSFAADYQLIGIYADQLELTRELPPELQVLFRHLPTDRTRLFDLTHVFTDSGKTAALQRLDRLSVGFATDHVVMRFRSPGHHLGQRACLQRHGHLQPLRPGCGGQGVQNRR